MKYYFSLLFFIIPFLSNAKQTTEEISFAQLKTAISNSEGGKKLVLMDSLSNEIVYSDTFDNDSVIRATVSFAKQLDSANIAVWHTANLIYFLNNVKGSPKEAEAIYLENKKWVAAVKDPEVLSKYYFEAGNMYYYLNEFEKSLQLFDSTNHYAQINNNYKFMGLSKLGQGGIVH